MKKSEITYEVIEELAVLSIDSSGWKLEANLVSWNGQDPKIDIRKWSPDRKIIGKGVTLNNEEEKKLLTLLENRQKNKEE